MQRNFIAYKKVPIKRHFFIVVCVNLTNEYKFGIISEGIDKVLNNYLVKNRRDLYYETED